MVYCRTVHCFLKIWSNKRTHPNERRNVQRPPCCHSWRHSRWQRNGTQTNQLSGRIFTHNLGNSPMMCHCCNSCDCSSSSAVPMWPIMCWWDVKPYSINQSICFICDDMCSTLSVCVTHPAHRPAITHCVINKVIKCLHTNTYTLLATVTSTWYPTLGVCWLRSRSRSSDVSHYIRPLNHSSVINQCVVVTDLNIYI